MTMSIRLLQTFRRRPPRDRTSSKLKAFCQEYCQTVEDLPGVGKVVAPSYGLAWRVQQRTRGLGQ